MADKREKLVRKLKDALDEDKTLQGDFGVQEIEEALLFILEDSAPKDTIVPEASKLTSGSRESKGNPEFEANKDSVRETRRENEVRGRSEGDDLVTSQSGPDKTENADSSLGHMNESNPETVPDKMPAAEMPKDTPKDNGPAPTPKFPGLPESKGDRKDAKKS